MKNIVALLLLFLSLNANSQQVIELCDYNRNTFTYSSYSNTPGSWYWMMNGDTLSYTNSVTITWADTGYYTIEVFLDAQCPAPPKKYQVQVVLCAESAIYFPNSFTPNNDGINDVWGPKGYNIATVNWSIWNRWGEMIFESDGINTDYATTCCWDGSYKGNAYYVPDGVYVYKASWKDIKGRVGEKIGLVVLVR
jgi:gliding motility-associated-like protein